MGSVDISVIVLTCNRVERCLDSLEKNQAELASFNTEWWVVNNGREPLELPCDPPAPTRLIQMPRNGGTAARNAILGKANGSCILMIDDDAYIPGAAVAHAFELMQQNPGAGGVILPVKNEGCLLPTIFHGCAVLLSTTALEAAGGYPTDYLYYGEEYEVSFRLAAAGYKLLQAAPGTPEAIHVRDSLGRNKSNILYRIVRNNTCCWARSLPFRHLMPAIYDTVHRYHHIAIKEKSRKGYYRGLAAMPAALIRGFFSRHALNEADFGIISLNQCVAEAAQTAVSQGIQRIAFCGLGKFPSNWIKIIKKNGLEAVAILEQNIAFHNQYLRGVPILPPEALGSLGKEVALLSGTSSALANRFWKETLERAGYSTISPDQEVQVWTI